MNIGFIIFDDMTILDFIGIYEPIYRLQTMGVCENIEIDLCSMHNLATDYSGRISLIIPKITHTLKTYDMIIVPGGYGTRLLMNDVMFLDWIKSARRDCIKVSVCTGALILGKAGFLAGKRATTHPNELERLGTMCQEAVCERIVEDGNVITGGGVSASIDVGLYICEKLAGAEASTKIRKQMDYLQ